MMKFEKITANVVCVLEYATEFLVAWHVYKIFDSAILGVLSLVGLSLIYSYTALASVGVFTFDIEKAKDAVTKLQPYWLVANTVICILLSRLG